MLHVNQLIGFGGRRSTEPSINVLLIVAGQSNARSFDTTGSDVPGDLQFTDADIQIWNTQTNTLQTYEAGTNSDTWNSGATTPQKWGPEAGFANEFRSAHPTSKLYIVKVAVDSTHLAAGAGDDWSPSSSSELFDDMTAEITATLSAMGIAPDEIVLLWMQGEHDALDGTEAAAYETNLTDFITAVRTDWGDTSTKVIIGRISDSSEWTFGDDVREGQVAVALADALTEIVDTDGYTLAADDKHYVAASVQTLGEDMFAAYEGTYVHAPTDISLTANSVPEGSPQGTIIGVLSATGGFAPYVFTLTDDAGDKAQVSGTSLQAGSTAPGTNGQSFNITVRVTDAMGQTYDEIFSISVSAPIASVGKALIYSGNGTSQSITGAGFSPDLVAIKARNATTGWRWTDTVRGVTLAWASSSNTQEVTEAGGVTSFDGDGFSVGNDADYNANTVNFVALVMEEVAGAFDIVTYTGNGTSGRTVSHSLGVTPDLIITANRSATANRAVYPGPLSSPATKFLQFQTNAAVGTSTTVWNDTAPTSSVFTVGNSSSVNTNTNNYVAYLFANSPGNVSVGTYTGDGADPGPFITTGFKPRFVLVKRTDNTGDWVLFDDARDTSNPSGTWNTTDGTGVEATVGGGADFQATGFQFTNSAGASVNTNGATYLYLAVR